MKLPVITGPTIAGALLNITSPVPVSSLITDLKAAELVGPFVALIGGSCACDDVTLPKAARAARIKVRRSFMSFTFTAYSSGRFVRKTGIPSTARRHSSSGT